MNPDLEVSAIDSNGSLRHVVRADKLEVQRPYPAVLGEREGLEGSIKRPPRLGHLPLVHEELAVVQPDSRHLQRYRDIQ